MFKIAFLIGALSVPHLALAMAGSPMHSGGGFHHHDERRGCTEFSHPFAPHPPSPTVLWSTQTHAQAERAAELQRIKEEDERTRREAEETARTQEKNRREAERRDAISRREANLRGLFNQFIQTSDHTESSVSEFTTQAIQHLIRSPENLSIALEYFNSEARLVYRLTIAGILYVTQPHPTEITHWLRNTGEMTEHDLSQLDTIRAFYARLNALPVATFATGCALITPSDGTSSYTEEWAQIQPFVHYVLSKQTH